MSTWWMEDTANQHRLWQVNAKLFAFGCCGGKSDHVSLHAREGAGPQAADEPNLFRVFSLIIPQIFLLTHTSHQASVACTRLL